MSLAPLAKRWLREVFDETDGNAEEFPAAMENIVAAEVRSAPGNKKGYFSCAAHLLQSALIHVFENKGQLNERAIADEIDRRDDLLRQDWQQAELDGVAGYKKTFDTEEAFFDFSEVLGDMGLNAKCEKPKEVGPMEATGTQFFLPEQSYRLLMLVMAGRESELQM